MTDPQLALVMLGIMLIIIMLGFPIAFSLLALGLFFGFYAMEFRIFDLMVEKTNEVMTNDVLVALPLFLFMGYMVERANILDRLFRSIQVAARHVPASIAVASLVTCALFATATGIVGAVVTLMGVLAYPAMLRANYDPRLSAGVICAGGTLGILIPPSVMLILYGATVGESVVRLYAAALLPGFLLAGMYVVYVIGRAIINPSLAPKLPQEESTQPFGRVLLLLITSFFPLAVLIFAVLGAIMFGLATPSEAAAVGALGAILLAAALPRAHLGPAARGGLSDRALVGHGLLPVRRLGHLCRRVRLPERPCLDPGDRPGAESQPDHVLDLGPVHHFPARLAARMDRDHRHLRAHFPALAPSFQHRPAHVRHPDRAEPADFVPHARRWRCPRST